MHSPGEDFKLRKAFLRNSTYDLKDNFHEDTLKTRRNPYLLQLNFNKKFQWQAFIYSISLLTTAYGFVIYTGLLSIWGINIEIKDWKSIHFLFCAVYNWFILLNKDLNFLT